MKALSGKVPRGRESTGSLTSMNDCSVKARQAKVKDSYISRGEIGEVGRQKVTNRRAWGLEEWERHSTEVRMNMSRDTQTEVFCGYKNK